MARNSVRIEGLRELDRALAELPKSTGKNVLRRVLRKRGQPLADAMRGRAPKETESLIESIGVSTKLSKRQRKLHRKMFRNDKASVEVFVGAGTDPAAVQQEFGNVNHGPQPFARPAWDAEKNSILDGIRDDIAEEIGKAADRLARKRARQAA